MESLNIDIASRRDARINRVADLTVWNKNKLPEVPSIYDVVVMPIPGATIKRVLFSEGQWITDQKIVAWKNPATNTNPMASKISNPIPMENWTLEPIDIGNDIEKAMVIDLAKKEMNRGGVDVTITRVFKAGESANGVVSGKILATSENYAAQSINGNDIFLHSQDSLSRIVKPGEYVTLEYKDGKANVFDGCLFDIKVNGIGYSDTELLFLRKKLQDALSMFQNKPTQDCNLIAATIWAKNETINEFNLKEDDVRINSLVVEDTFTNLTNDRIPNKPKI